MEGATKRAILRVQLPARWPAAPDVMNFSMLMDIEACPHRWALAEAAYDGVWSGRGYPRPLQIASLTGVVVHISLQTIVSALARSGCTSLASPEAVAVMKQLGGYSAVLERAILELLTRYAVNPRARHLLEHSARTLKSQIPEMRTQVQNFVLRANFVAARSASVRNSATTPSVRERRALSPGTYTELAVVAPAIGWNARLDLLSLTTEQCAITEYKTGAASDTHSLQVKIYALLWYRDSVLNPGARPANKLVVSYRSGDVPVAAPDVNELVMLEKTIVDRSAAAKRAIAQSPPSPMPHRDQCFHCHVRHLCAAYWSGPVQQQLASPTDPSHPFGDIEIVIQRAHGPSSWIADVHGGLPRLAGQSVLLRSRVDGLLFAPHMHLRLLGIHIRFPDAFEEIATITVGTLSEVFQCA